MKIDHADMTALERRLGPAAAARVDAAACHVIEARDVIADRLMEDIVGDLYAFSERPDPFEME